MSFLLAKVLFLVAASALLGALFARWYLRRNFQDVTADYTRLEGELQTWRRSFETKLAQRPSVDLKPLQAHMEQIEAAIRGIDIPKPIATDLSPVIGAIAAIPAAASVDFQPLLTQLERIDALIRGINIPKPVAADFSPVLSAIAAIPVPAAVNIQPLQAQLSGVEQAVKSIVIPAPKNIDLSTIQARLEMLESAVRAIVIPASTQVDLQPVMQKLAELEARATIATPRASTPEPQEPRVVPVSVVVSTSSLAPSVRAGSRNLLSHAGFGSPDNLQQIKGVKKVMEKMLHDIGVYYFWQIAEWTPQDIRHADAQLTAFHGRIERDDWVAQATAFGRATDAAAKPEAMRSTSSAQPLQP